MNAILSKLGLWLWFLLPANPILVRVVQGASKRTKHLYLRIGYLAVLLTVVLLSLFSSMSQGSASLSDLAQGASQTFKYGAMMQLALMCFLAPAFTASAITQERDAQTFNILLSTPLSSAQIVFGSLMSRLYFVLMLLLAGLPIFLMTMVYGGVTTSQIVESFALAAATAFLTGAIAIFVAMAGVGTRRTILSFYLVIAIYLLSIYLAGAQWPRTWVEVSAPNLDGRRMSWLTALHPFLSLEVALNRVYAPDYSRLTEHSAIARYALAFPSATYVAWTTITGFLLTTASIVFVRRGAKMGEPTFFGNITNRLRRRVGGGDGARSRKPRTVWKNPVAWREAKTRASGGWALRWAIIIGGFAGPFILFTYRVNGGLSPGIVHEWLSGLIIVQLALALIVATNTAATAITKEKESKSMDLLLSTPLTSKYILWGKLRGLVSFAVPLLFGPIVVLLMFAVYAMMNDAGGATLWIESVIELGALLIIYTAFGCVVGLWRSLNSKTNAAAMMHSLGVLIVGLGIASLIGFNVVEPGSGAFGAFLSAFTPFTAVRYLVDPRALFNTPTDFAQGASEARIAALIGASVATGLYAFIVWRLYTGLVRNFDMTLRKQSSL